MHRARYRFSTPETPTHPYRAVCLERIGNVCAPAALLRTPPPTTDTNAQTSEPALPSCTRKKMNPDRPGAPPRAPVDASTLLARRIRVFHVQKFLRTRFSPSQVERLTSAQFRTVLDAASPVWGEEIVTLDGLKWVQDLKAGNAMYGKEQLCRRGSRKKQRVAVPVDLSSGAPVDLPRPGTAVTSMQCCTFAPVAQTLGPVLKPVTEEGACSRNEVLRAFCVLSGHRSESCFMEPELTFVSERAGGCADAAVRGAPVMKTEMSVGFGVVEGQQRFGIPQKPVAKIEAEAEPVRMDI